VLRLAAAFEGGGKPQHSKATLALFPNVSMTWNGTTLTLRNDGDMTLRAAEYGQPGYRAILKFGDSDRWIALPKDLHPGEAVSIELQAQRPITLTNALEGIPIVDETPAAEVR
jgi:hypothetical protein